MGSKTIYCCGCEKDVQARLTNGKEIYPHRNDLHSLPFWKCDTCRNYVGCHHKTKNRTNPLGVIPTKEIMNARREIHKLIDPLWKSGMFNRRKLYSKISEKVGWEYHTACIKSVEEARKVYRAISEVADGEG
jgi:hypothetical protein